MAWGVAVGAKGGPACLSSGDAAEVVSARKVVPPRDAVGVARRAVPDGQVLRAALCGEPSELVYHITVLRRDGRMMRVTVDARSGKLHEVR